jgi:hypothetical protein
MTSALSPRALAAMLRQLQQEKEERLRRESSEETKKLEREEEERKRELEHVTKKKKDLADKLKREQESLERLKEEAAQQVTAADEEHRVEHLQRRIQEFRGNNDEDLKERLIAEGFGEALVNTMLRLRTLDEKVKNDTGLQARFSHRNDLVERMRSGAANLYDATDRRLLEHIEGIRERALSKGYLAADEERELRDVAYHLDRFEQNPLYREKDDRGYISKTNDTIQDIKAQLGLDWSASTLTYGGKRL